MKLEIWGDVIPYNNKQSKLKDMEYLENRDKMTNLVGFIKAIQEPNYRPCKSDYDNFTYSTCIKSGIEKETFEDVPYVKPFLVKDSDSAVIVVPGGGFSYKSIDTDEVGHQGEGDLIARALNDVGINAFVFWYRTAPYRMPVELLDMQRAVRFVRYHAAEYGINPNKIGAIGFSAGGFEVGQHINITKGTDMFPKNYIKDKIDSVSDALNSAALVYPCLTLRYNETLVYPLFGETVADKPEKMQKCIEKYDCITHFDSTKVPQFLNYGTSDQLLNADFIQEYAAAAKSKNCDVTVTVLEGVDHGYGACENEEFKQYGWWLKEYVKWQKKQFDKTKKVKKY